MVSHYEFKAWYCGFARFASRDARPCVPTGSRNQTIPKTQPFPKPNHSQNVKRSRNLNRSRNQNNSRTDVEWTKTKLCSKFHAFIKEPACVTSKMSMLSTNNNENTEEQFNSEVAEKMLNNENQKESKKVKVYPNPNNGTFTLEVSDSYLDGEMMLFDTYGKMLYLETVKQNKMQIMRNLERGVYYVTIVNGNNKHVEKIIVQ